MDPAQILVVCTGNVCRSPFAERLLAARLHEAFAQDVDVVVRSAGTHALVGDPMTEPMSRRLEHHGRSGTDFSARLLEAWMVEQADLVVAMTRKHRGAVAKLRPRATRYSFTLRELVRLVESAAPALRLPDGPVSERVRALVPQLAARRGMSPLADPLDDDVTDPYRRPAPYYDLSVEEMLPGVDALVWAIAEGGR